MARRSTVFGTSPAMGCLVAVCGAALVAQAAAFAPAGAPMRLSGLGGAAGTASAAPPLRGLPVATKRRAGGASMVVGGGELGGAVGGLLLAEEIFGQVAAGGILIILSGVIGAFVVGAIVNVDELEESYRELNPNADLNTQAGRKARLQRIGDIEDLPEEVEKEMQDGGDKKA